MLSPWYFILIGLTGLTALVGFRRVFNGIAEPKMLRWYLLAVTLESACELALLFRWSHLTRAQYQNISWAMCLADNLLLFLLAAEITSIVLKKVSRFAALWLTTLSTVVFLSYAFKMFTSDPRVLMNLAVIANAAVVLTISGCFFLPLPWRKRTRIVAAGVLAMAGGNTVLNLLPLGWIMRYPFAYACAVLLTALVSVAVMVAGTWVDNKAPADRDAQARDVTRGGINWKMVSESQ